jgi:molecular chaperone DnaJ
MDFYVVLGLTRGATESDIKRAYRRLARRFHPDINPGDRAAEVRFRQILEAYETLVDPDRRSRYEAGVRPDTASEGRGSGFEGFDFSPRGAEPAVTFGDLFADVLRDRGRTPPPAARGADLHLDVQLSFHEAFGGVSRPIVVTRRVSCRRCAGTGRARASGAPCLVCHGRGTARSVRGHMVFSRPCGGCGGSGHQRPHPCELCTGLGQETRAETLEAGIPAGVADGECLRVEGMGNSGAGSGPSGDLYLTVHVAPHAVFRRDGHDLHVTVPVAVHEAALGARIDVPIPEGSTRIRVPPGTQSGHRFRLRGRGMPTRDGARGDLLVMVQLRLPAILDERSKELLREFGRINAADDVREPRPGEAGSAPAGQRTEPGSGPAGSTGESDPAPAADGPR